MSDEHRDLLAGEALGALADDEAEEARVLADGHPALARELEEYRGTVSLLEAGVVREAPSHDLFAGILAEIEPATARPEPERSSGRAWSWRRALPAFAVGAAVTAAVFAIALALNSDDSLGTPDTVAAVQGTPDFTSVHGEARIYGAETQSGLLRLDLAEVPPAPDGEHYEVWVLRTASGETMEAVGVFDPTTSEVRLELGLPGAGDYVAVDISVEPDAGPPEHSGTSLAGGEFEAPTA